MFFGVVPPQLTLSLPTLQIATCCLLHTVWRTSTLQTRFVCVCGSVCLCTDVYLCVDHVCKFCTKSGRTDSAWLVTGLAELAENLPVPVMGWSIGEPLPFSLLLTPFISCSKFLLFDITIQSNCLLFSQLFKPQGPSNSLAKATLCMAGKGKTIAMLVFSDPAFLFLNKT